MEDEACASINLFLNEMTADFNVLCPFKEEWPGSNMDSTSIVSNSGVELRIGTPNSWRRRCNCIVSLLADDMERYFTSAYDFETFGCFLHFHAIGELPRNIHFPVVEQRVPGHLANQHYHRHEGR